MSDTATTPILPAHIEDTVQAIARLHAEHYHGATPRQRFIERMTARAGRPEFLGVLTVLIAGWMALNLILVHLGKHPLDEPPFFWMQGVIGVAALYMTTLILTTQRREDQLATHREQLTLELAILSEQKASKIVALLEELRRDSSGIRDRVDSQADALSTPADPQAVLDAIKGTNENAGLAGRE